MDRQTDRQSENGRTDVSVNNIGSWELWVGACGILTAKKKAQIADEEEQRQEKRGTEEELELLVLTLCRAWTQRDGRLCGL